MSNVQFLVAFSIMPIGGLLLGILIYYLTSPSRTSSEASRISVLQSLEAGPMSNLEFRAAFGLVPSGALVATAVVRYFTPSDRHHSYAAG